MGILIKNFIQLLKVLHSETGTHQVAAGFAAGFVLGMSPFLSLQGLMVFTFILFFRIQLGAALVGAFLFSFIAFLLDPFFHYIGAIFLTNPSYEPLWTHMYNLPLLPLTRFNNTVILGAGIVTICLIPLIYLLAYLLIKKYRKTVVGQVKASAFFKSFQASKVYQWYSSYSSLYH